MTTDEPRRNWIELAASYELIRALLEQRSGDEARARQAVHAADDLLPAHHALSAAVWCATAVTEQRPTTTADR